MINRRPILYYCIALIFGCYSALLTMNGSIIGAVLAASFFACLYFTQKSSLVFVALLFLLLGFINYYLYFNIHIGDNAVFRINKINTYNMIGTYKGKRVILKSDMVNLRSGEKISVKGSYKYVPQFEKGIVGEYDISIVENISSDYITSIYRFKELLYGKYAKQIGEKWAANVMAGAFGDASYLDDSDKDDMSKLGIVHVISVSGMHMALLYKICEYIFGFGTGILLSLIYCIFTGAPPSTVRAFVMILVFKLSKKVYKKYDGLSSLGFSAMIIIMISPYTVLDTGTLLSFLAVLGILLFYDKLKRKLYLLPDRLNEYISLSLSAQVFTLPLSIMIFNSLSTSFIQGNIFIVPIYSAIVVLGNLSMVFVKIDTVFYFLCLVIRLAMLALEGGKKLILMISTDVIYLSYIDALTVIIIYISFMLYKSGRKKFVYLPSFIIFLYIYSSFNIIPQIEYVKVGNTNAVIYRNKFESSLFVSSPKLYEDKLLLYKKFNVSKVEWVNSERVVSINGDYSLSLENAGNDIRPYLTSDGGRMMLSFIQKGWYRNSKENCDIIYLTYNKGYNYYESLLSVKIINGRLVVF